MAETRLPHRRRQPARTSADVFPEGGQARWLLRNRFDLWSAFATEAEDRHADHTVRSRLERAIHLAKRWMLAKLVVTILLSLGVATAVLATASAYVPQLADVFAFAKAIFAPIATIAASASALLLLARIVISRMIVRYDVSAAFLAARDAERAGRGS